MTAAAPTRYHCTIACAPDTGFSIEPRGPFSLALANGFGFGHREARDDGTMRLAFAADGTFEPVGVALVQDPDGAVHGELHGPVPVAAARAQVERILSLDHDAEPYARIESLTAVQRLYPGLRPVLFNSPYEAAAWAVISARQAHAHAARVRDSIAERWGTVFELGGRRMAAFPPPQRLLEAVDAVEEMPAERRARIRGVAEAAADGRLEVDRLQALGPEAATAEVLRLRGIGPFYASLIVIRATGFADAFVADPGARAAAVHFGLADMLPDAAAFAALAEDWRPYRTWATVLLRYAGTHAGVIPKR